MTNKATHKEEEEIIYYCPICDYSNTWYEVYTHLDDEHTAGDLKAELLHTYKLARRLFNVSKARVKQ